MKKVAFLSIYNLEGYEYFDHLLFDPMVELGWTVDVVPWRKTDVDWNEYDSVLVRSTWDYQSDPQNFIKTLEKIDKSSARLENNIEVIKWNINKNYLSDLEKNNVRIVKTLWQDNFVPEFAPQYFDLLETEEIIIKPNISACAGDTFRLNLKSMLSRAEQLKSVFNQREFMVQPFMKSILNEGEYSLLFFGGKYSHTNLKKPKSEDFRVQAEHGGIFSKAEPESKLLERAENIIRQINPLPLYGRVDMVRTDDNDFAVMELELIEPSLYLQIDGEAPSRFAKIFDEWMS